MSDLSEAWRGRAGRALADDQPYYLNGIQITPYIPSEEDIRRACLEIQEGWSEAERLKRAGIIDPASVLHWEPPDYSRSPSKRNKKDGEWIYKRTNRRE